MAEPRLALLLLVAVAGGSACLTDAPPGAPPSIADLIFGSLPLRSAAYYERQVAIAAEGGESSEHYSRLAVAHVRLGHPDRAVELLKAARRRWPEQPATLGILGTALALSGCLDEAVAVLEESAVAAPGGCERLELLLLRHELQERRERVATSFLGFEFATRLGAGFRGAALTGEDARGRELARRHALNRLELASETVDELLHLLRSYPDQAELYFTLGELLAAMGERPLAWHAYQRALDLGHPRSADLPWYQSQVRDTLARAARGSLTEVSHYRARRRALDWVAARQEYERRLIAAGGDPDDPTRYEAFEREKPRPTYEF